MPLPVTPRGSFARPLAALVYLVAASTKFQTLVSAASADAALDWIHWPHAPDAAPVRPRAIVQPPGMVEVAGLGTGTWKMIGDAWLSFEFLPFSDPPDDKTDIIEFMSQFGEILDEMMEISRANLASPAGTETYLNVRNYRSVEGPATSIPSEEDGVLFYGVTLAIFW